MNTYPLSPWWQKLVTYVRSPHGVWWLLGVSFLEPIILPLWPESVMVALILANRARWKRYVLITTGASIVGAAVGYLIGAALFHWFGDATLHYFNLHKTFRIARGVLTGNILLVMLFITFTPMPDKAFIILSGFLHVPFTLYLLGFAVGRTLRFGVVGYVSHSVGGASLAKVRSDFRIIAIVIAVVLVVLIARMMMRAW